jgi:cyclopropane fatty-acyl-phospholipid synthase-like methyltransferase
VAKAGDKARTAKDRSLDKACGSLLQKICQKYDNLNEIDKLASVSLKVESVKLVMQDNVDLALQNCVKLESIEKAAEELQQQAGVFKRNAHELKKRMWWKNLKVCMHFFAIGNINCLIILWLLGTWWNV